MPTSLWKLANYDLNLASCSHPPPPPNYYPPLITALLRVGGFKKENAAVTQEEVKIFPKLCDLISKREVKRGG